MQPEVSVPAPNHEIRERLARLQELAKEAPRDAPLLPLLYAILDELERRLYNKEQGS